MNSFVVCSDICPGPPNRDPMDSEKRLRVYTSAATMARHEWRVDKSSGKNVKKSECVLRRSPLGGTNFFPCYRRPPARTR